MIPSFKKGSYRILTLTVLFLTALSMLTLASAFGRPLPVVANNTPVKSTDTFLQPKGLITYNRLDRVVKVADFHFEVPGTIPSGFHFSEGMLSKSIGSKSFNLVTLSFQANTSKRRGEMSLEITRAANDKEDGVVKLINDILKLEKDAVIEERNFSLKGLDIKLISASREDGLVNRYYVWSRNEVSYNLILRGSDITEQEAAAMISSMKPAGAGISNTYINPNALAVDVIFGEDLQLAASSIGFTPKLPLKVMDFKLQRAYVTSKINFSYPRSDKEAQTRVLFGWYELTAVASPKSPQGFKLLQMKDDGQFAAFKTKKEVQFFQNDGQPGKVPAELISIKGTQVLRTSPVYTSHSSEPVWVHYFWSEKGISYQLAFRKGQVKNMEAVVAAFIQIAPLQIQK